MRPHLSITAGAVAGLCVWFSIDPLHTFGPFLLAMSLHELGHLLLLAVQNVPIGAIRLTALGCSIQTGAMSYRAERRCAAAGPAVNILLYFLFRHTHPTFALVSLCLAAYNLLPIWPLDGGRILRSTLLLHITPAGAARIERAVGAAVCLVVSAGAVCLTCRYHLGLWPVLLAALLLGKAGGSQFTEKQVAKPRLGR